MFKLPPKTKKATARAAPKKLNGMKKAAPTKRAARKKTAPEKTVSKKKPPKTPAIYSAAGKRNVQFSETPTVLGSHKSQANWLNEDEKDDMHNLIVLRSNSQASSTQHQQSTTAEQPPPPCPSSNPSSTTTNQLPPPHMPAEQTATSENIILSLEERLPSIASLLDTLRSHHCIKAIRLTPKVFTSNEEVASYFDEYFRDDTREDASFWTDVWETFHDIILDHTPLSASQVSELKASYNKTLMSEIELLFGCRIPSSFRECEASKKLKLCRISRHIGMVCIDVFEKNIVPPGGKQRVSIPQQLDNLLTELETKELTEYFPDKELLKNIYYAAGFLCSSGQNEAERRTKQIDSGDCIGAIKSHFATNPQEVEILKQTLPPGVVDLVDHRSVHGGLTYPDLQFFSFICRIEFCYATLAAPNNFLAHGGTLLASICEAIETHENFIEDFTATFPDGQYSDTSITAAFHYYLRVYSNLRLKDLCYKYNGMLKKTTVVGLGQSLAGIMKGKQRSKKKSNDDLDNPLSEQQIH